MKREFFYSKLFLMMSVIFLLGIGSWIFFYQQGSANFSALNKDPEEEKVVPLVKLFEVKKVAFDTSIEGLIGTVKGDTLELNFGQQEGKVDSVHVKVGDSVLKDDILLELDHTTVKARLSQAKIAWRRVKKLYEAGGATSHEVQEAHEDYKIRLKEYRDTFIYAPQSGTISEINKQAGETVKGNDTVVVLVSGKSDFYLEVGVIESLVHQVLPGKKAKVTLESLGEKDIDTEVTGVAREVSTTGRMGVVHVKLPKKIQSRLRPGLSAECEILTYENETLVIPAESYHSEKKIVFVYEADGDSGKLKERKITLGHKRFDYYEVLSGLQEEDRVVSNLSTYLIEANKTVRPESQDDTFPEPETKE